ncbi:MAG: hypothetical protein HOI95_16170 [Chromatiales bacterium]|jgi:hypothetical protein|nr:hypothetical protein [Chromatiales bacterium]
MNPELQRYIWLELSTQRLVLMPLIQILFFTVLLAGQYYGDPTDLASTAFWLVVLLGGAWGTRLAGEAVIDEVNAGTWDQQRLSSLSPWSMTWGKLVGAPVFTWYGCIPLLLVIVVCMALDEGASSAAFFGMMTLLMVVSSHAVSLLASLHTTLHGTVLSRRVSFGLQLTGLMALTPWALLLSFDLSAGFATPITWMGHCWTVEEAAFATLACFTFWTISGCYRLMRRELRVRNLPWVWCAFVVFCMVYASGWHPGLTTDGTTGNGAWPATLEGSVLAGVTALSLAYLVLIVMPKDPVTVRRIGRLLGTTFNTVDETRPDGAQPASPAPNLPAGQALRTAFELAPLWIYTFALAMFAGLAAIAVSIHIELHGVAMFVGGALLFFVRDAGIVMFANSSGRRRRADTAALVYLAILYALLPSILLGVFEVNPAGYLFASPELNPLTSLLPVVLQVAVTWVAVYVRWQHNWGSAEGPAPSL